MSDKYPGGFVTANAPAGFSVAFDGTGDSLTAPQGSAFQFPGDFTIECWVYANNSVGGASYDGVFDTRSGNVVSSNSAGINYKDNGYLNMYVGGTNTSSSTLLGAKQWVHVALVRSGSSVVMYQNGVSVATATNSANLSDGYCTIGGFVAGGYWNGYISNVRVVKGTAVYTTTFTPPTQLFPVSGTSLLTCQSPTIIDNSTNAFTITAAGDAKVSNFTPFAAYQGFNPALGAAAGGVWTLDEAAYYQNNRQWPIYDPYFNQTTLMLHGNGTNAAQNNTFLDSSTNNFTITRNGNTAQGTFSPFSQTGWSNYFVNTSYISLPANSVTVGASDFSLEAWIYPADRSNAYYIFGGQSDRATLGGSSYNFLMASSTGYLLCEMYIGGGSYPINSTVAPALNAWSHVAFVRTGGVASLFINGISVASRSDLGTSAINTGSTTYVPAIGANGAGSSTTFSGYISNLKFIIGSGGYTANQNFTPPTTQLTATTNTRLLSCQNNRFVDNSATNNALTPVNSPTVQAFSPFVPAYITPTTYSNWFDGTGDYLTAPNAAWMDLGTGSFTMECWVQFNTVGSTQMIVSSNYNAGTGGGGWAFLYRQDNTTLKFSCNANVSYEKTWSPAAGTMYHVAVCRSGTDLRLFVNGVQIGTTSTSSDNISGSSLLFVGSNVSNPLPINGVISNLRIVTSALYTANFTPPTAPLTAVTNTQLLTCQSSTFVDNSVNAATFTAYGNVQPVTSPTPFPAKVDTTTLNSAYSASLIGGSGYFDGTGDYLVAPNDTVFDFGSGNFTIEFWVYSNGDNEYMPVEKTINGAFGSWYIQVTSGSLKWNCSSTGSSNDMFNSVNVGTVPTYAWTHIAIVRSGTTFTGYINGVGTSLGTSSSAIYNSSYGITVGAHNGTSSYDLNGHIAGLRLIKGTAAYTSNFTPPTAPPTAITNTSLLLNFTNAGIIDNAAKNVLETVGNAQISTTQSKYGGSSMYCPTTNGNYFVSPPNQQNFLFGTGQFTVEAWIYPLAFTNTASGAFGYGLSGGYVDWNLEISTAGAVLYIDNDAGRFTSSSNLSANVWTHLCVVRTSTAVTMYFNGVSVGTYATINNISGSSTSARLYVGTGAQQPASRQFVGYIDDLRITKGVARYVTNFTPPTSQLQDQ